MTTTTQTLLYWSGTPTHWVALAAFWCRSGCLCCHTSQSIIVTATRLCCYYPLTFGSANGGNGSERRLSKSSTNCQSKDTTTDDYTKQPGAHIHMHTDTAFCVALVVGCSCSHMRAQSISNSRATPACWQCLSTVPRANAPLVLSRTHDDAHFERH